MKATIQKRFTIKDGGNVKFFLEEVASEAASAEAGASTDRPTPRSKARGYRAIGIGTDAGLLRQAYAAELETAKQGRGS